MSNTEVATPEVKPPVEKRPAASDRRRLRLWGKKVGLLAGSTMVCLALLEVVFRVAGYQPIYSVYSKPDVFWKRHPIIGWVLEPGATGTFVGPRPFPIEFRARVRINSLGFRGPEVTAVPAGGRRVLLLGDSQAAGFEVAEDQTYGALTAEQLTGSLRVPVQVLNAAVRGYGTDQSLLWYGERGRPLQPDLVVFHATANDPEDDTTLHRMRRQFGKAAFALTPEGTRRMVGTPIPRYPVCSAYRLDPSFRVVRIDGRKARLFCWTQTRLADHSAFLTFLSSRIERNPRLVKALYGLGTPQEQVRPIPPSTAPSTAPSSAASTAPPSAPPASARPAEPEPPASAAGQSPTTTPGPPADPEAAPAVNPAVGYAPRLTTTLILDLAAQVRRDGAGFVLLIDSADLARLDGAALQTAAIDIVRADEALAADQRPFRFPNDGHLNVAGHRRMAAHLAPRLAAVLQPPAEQPR